MFTGNLQLSQRRGLRRMVMAAALTACSFIAVPTAAAQYPDKPIRLIVPFGAGGTSDILGRTVGAALASALGQTVVVENRPGANGNIGSNAVARAQADGYTLLLAADGTMVINPNLYADLPFNPRTDFAAISRVAVVPLVLVANPSVKANSVGELIDLSKKGGQTLDFGSAGMGSMGHLTGELLKHKTGINMQHIPYKSGGQAVTDVVSGQIQMLMTALPVAGPFLADKKLKAIAVTSGKRFSGAPSIPTIAESGVADFDSPSWYGLLAPAGTPEAVLDKLHTTLANVLTAPEMAARMEQLGAIPVVDSRSEFTARIKTDIDNWADIIKTANITLQ
jgi:tripartite-type tricarboxylate transporter receptor subunit TctC